MAPTTFHSRDGPLTILVTGFGPFMDLFPVNPSFEIAKQLPEVLPGTDTRKKVRIIIYPKPVKVVFEDVRELIPRLHNEYRSKVDLVLHIGMASGQNFYELERSAHRDGYNKNKDLDGQTPPADQGKQLFADCPTTMQTSLPYDEIVQNWQANVRAISKGTPGFAADVRPSNDAGHYLCDYIYFQSLAYFARKSGVYEAGKPTDRPVLFFHVPAESDPETLAKGRAVAIGLVEAIAEACSQPSSNGYH